MLISLVIFALLTTTGALLNRSMIKSLTPVIETQRFIELMKGRLDIPLRYTFPSSIVCSSLLSDQSSFAAEIINLLYKHRSSPTISRMPRAFDKFCRDYIVVARDISTLKSVIVQISRLSKIRIAVLIEKTTEEELDKTLEHELDIFGDVEFTIFTWTIGDIFYRVRQPSRIVEKIRLESIVNSSWSISGGIIKNFHRRIIRITTHNCTIFTKIARIKEDGSSDFFLGNDAVPFQEIARKLNLTYKFVEPAPGKLYGAYKNHSWVGGLFENLSTKKADVAACGCWWDYRKLNTGLEMSFPLRTLCITYLVPRRELTSWTQMFQPLELSTWLLLTTSWFVMSGVLTAMARLMMTMEINQAIGRYCGKRRYISIGRTFFEAYGVIVNGAWPQPNDKLGPLRHLITWWVIFALLINCCYSSTLISHLTMPSYQNKPRTIKDLVEGGYSWITERDFSYDRLWDTSDPTIKKWTQRHIQTTYTAKLEALKSKSKIVIVGFKLSGDNFFVIYNELPSSITQRFDIMDRCLARVSESFIHRIGSPFIASVDHYIVALIESGLIQFYERKFSFAQDLPRPIQFKDTSSVHNKNLSLRDLKGIFIWLLLGNTLSITAFASELIWATKQKRVSNNSNKKVKPVSIIFSKESSIPKVLLK